MPTVTARDLDWSHATMVDLFAHSWSFNGLSGERCSCGATANVGAGGPGWFCPCGRHNCQSWSHHQMPHDNPTYGPSLAQIRAAISEARSIPSDKNDWLRRSDELMARHEALHAEFTARDKPTAAVLTKIEDRAINGAILGLAPGETCAKCGHQVKERQLFTGTFIGCMC